MATPQIVLQLQQVSYKNILNNCSVAIAAGSRTGIVGASGSGKTTLLRLLNRLIDPTVGKIYAWGKDIQQLPVGSLRRRVMLVTQEPTLLGMQVSEAIAYPLKLVGMPKSQIQDRLDLWLDKLQFDSNLIQRSELQLSVGQRQWVAIARALVTEPDILLLDEPTSALDRFRAGLLLDILQELTQTQRSTTVVMVNHQLDLMTDWCSYLVQLHRGNLVRSQTASEVNWQAVQQDMQDMQDMQRDMQSGGSLEADEWQEFCL